MANPYHDAEGKFCSRDEMKGAIQAAQRAGNFDTYFQLRKDFEQIDKNRVEISKDAFDDFVKRSSIFVSLNENMDGNDIRLAYNSAKQGIIDNDSTKEKFLPYLRHPNLPDDVRQDILESIPEDTIAHTISKFNDDSHYSQKPVFLTRDDVIKLANRNQSYSVAKHVARNPLLTFEDKYNIVKQGDEGLAALAAEQPEVFFKDETLKQEFYSKMGKLDAEGNPIASRYHSVLAKHSNNPEDLSYVVENDKAASYDYGTPIGNLIMNKALTRDNAIAVLKNSIDHDIINAKQTAGTIARTLGDKGGYVTYELTEPPKNYYKSEPNPEDVKKVDSLQDKGYSLDVDKTNSIEHKQFIAAQARVDASEKNYKALTKEFKKVRLTKNAIFEHGKKYSELQARLIRAKNYVTISQYINKLEHLDK
jgi:hypothetical protein